MRGEEFCAYARKRDKRDKRRKTHQFRMLYYVLNQEKVNDY